MKERLSRAGAKTAGRGLRIGVAFTVGRACLTIVRPWAGASLVAAVVAVGWATESRFRLDIRLFLVISVIFLIASAAFPLNDVHDVLIDRIAHATRPLSRGDLSRRDALLLASCMIAIALFLAAWLGRFALAWASFVSIIVILYSQVKAKNAMLGNVLAALLFGAAIPSVLFTRDGPFDLPLIFACAGLGTLLIHAREIVKDVQDSPADAENGRASIPILYGVQAAYQVSGASVIVASVACLFMAIGKGGGVRVASIGLAGVLFVAGMHLLMTKRQSDAKTRVRELKVILLISILVLTVGASF